MAESKAKARGVSSANALLYARVSVEASVTAAGIATALLATQARWEVAASAVKVTRPARARRVRAAARA